jgi:hypothetical protein
MATTWSRDRQPTLARIAMTGSPPAPWPREPVLNATITVADGGGAWALIEVL